MSSISSRPETFRERVTNAAEAALKAHGAVGPIELFEYLGFLQPAHLDAWRKGHEDYRILEKWIQVGPAKFQKTMSCFAEWVQARGLRPIEASYTRRSPGGVEPLRVTGDGDPEREKFYRLRYAPVDLSPQKSRQLEKKLAKLPDLVVFEKVSREGDCSECGNQLPPGSYLTMEKGQPICLACADLDHLVFLPAGDTAMSRRSRKHSPLSAVVVRFNRSRERYERQGVLVTEEALEQAEKECAADAPERAIRRAEAAVHRKVEDVQFSEAVTEAIQRQFPGCPPNEAQAIARHTTLRGSGRVGRSAAGRELERRAIALAVVAHIRHQHTNYDELLMQGVERLEARQMVQGKIESVLAGWMAG